MELTRACNYESPISVPFASLRIRKSTVFELTLSFKQPNSNLPVILTTEIFSFHLRKSGDTVDFINLISSASPNTNGSTIGIIDGPNGKISILLTDEETNLLTFTDAEWYVAEHLSNGNVYWKLSGTATITDPYYA